MSDGTVQLVELLSVATARTDLDCSEGRPIVLVTVRPEPDRSWRPHNLALTWPQAERLRDDLSAILKTPATFLLLAALALSSGCSAKVEVTNEKVAAAEADSVATPPAAASAKHRTTVEIDVLGQRQPEPAAPKVANERPSPAESEGEPDERDHVTLIVVKEVHKHRHYHQPVFVGRHRWMSQCDEEERIRRIHEKKLRQYGVR